jgi:tetratricopeptide (TPR) repeat protein/predicted aspartyl protease
MAVRSSRIRSLAAFALFPVSGFAAQAEVCKIGRIAELPVTMNGLRPMVDAKIDGKDARFIADSGAFYSLISPAAAAEYTLRVDPAPLNIRLKGIGGSARAEMTTVKAFTIAGATLKNVPFFVGGADMGSGAAGLLGQNVLRIADVEYDLSNGAIRLMKPESGCSKTSMMAYWTRPGDAYSLIDIAWATPEFPHTTSTAYLDGTKIRVLFDTGAATSVLSLRAAERAGVKTDGPNVVNAGYFRGIGSSPVQTWIAPFDSFKIGDEEVKHTRLRIGPLSNPDADMLIGADFFLSHRVYVASSQHKLYFTYNGGPVFNLTSAPSGSSLPPAAAVPPPSTTADNSEPPPSADEPKDAAGFSRRGVAFAARRDFQHALADLNRACELAPNEPDVFFERGRAHLGNREPELALSDFDQAVKLKPDHVPALMSRVGLRLGMRERLHEDKDDAESGPAVLADLDKVDATVAKDSDVRLELGNFYARVGQFAQGVAQYDLWFAKHMQDARLADALAFRCRARGMMNQELDKALADCNRAIRERADTPFFLDSRGLVYLRMGNFARSIADYDAVLKLQPRNPWALYVRGVAKVRKGVRDEGESDIAASRAIAPRAAADAARQGIVP